jgi:hypothetical protein
MIVLLQLVTFWSPNKDTLEPSQLHYLPKT